MKPFEKFRRFLIHFLIINTDALFKFPSYKNILCYGQMPQHVKFLMHNHNTCILRFPCIMEFHFFPFKDDTSGVLRIYTGKDLHQSRFTCAVFSHQRMHFPFSHLEIHVIQRMYAREGFINIFHC